MRTIRTITTLTVASLAAPGAVWAAQAPLNYLPPFTTAEYCARHVQANSYPVPKDFVDGQWHGIVAAMQAAGNDITLVRLPGSRHAFIIPGYGRHTEIDAALAHSEDFLRRLGYLP